MKKINLIILCLIFIPSVFSISITETNNLVSDATEINSDLIGIIVNINTSGFILQNVTLDSEVNSTHIYVVDSGQEIICKFEVSNSSAGCNTTIGSYGVVSGAEFNANQVSYNDNFVLPINRTILSFTGWITYGEDVCSDVGCDVTVSNFGFDTYQQNIVNLTFTNSTEITEPPEEPPQLNELHPILDYDISSTRNYLSFLFICLVLFVMSWVYIYFPVLIMYSTISAFVFFVVSLIPIFTNQYDIITLVISGIALYSITSKLNAE